MVVDQADAVAFALERHTDLDTIAIHGRTQVGEGRKGHGRRVERRRETLTPWRRRASVSVLIVRRCVARLPDRAFHLTPEEADLAAPPRSARAAAIRERRPRTAARLQRALRVLTTWVVAGWAAVTFAIKASGPLAVGGRALPGALTRVIALMALTRLAAIIATNALADATRLHVGGTPPASPPRSSSGGPALYQGDARRLRRHRGTSSAPATSGSRANRVTAALRAL